MIRLRPRRRRRRRNHRSISWLCLLVFGFFAVDSIAAEPWSEPGYGVTFEPPAEAEVVFPPPPGSLAAWRLPDGAFLRIRILESDAAIVGFETTQALGWVGLTMAEPDSVWLDDREIAGRPGLLQVVELTEAPSKFLPPSVDGARQTYGQALAKLDPYRVAVAELFIPGHHAQEAQARLGKLADALSLVSPEILFQRRRAEIEAGAAFLRGLDRQSALDAIPARLDYDIEPADGGPGIRGLASREVVADPAEAARLDLALNAGGWAAGWSSGMDDPSGERLIVRDKAWASADGTREVWSWLRGSGVLVAGSPALGQPTEARDVQQTLRTGVRNDSDIDLIVTNPKGQARIARDTVRQWTLPKRLPPSLIDEAPLDVQLTDVFLSRLDVLLLPEWLPRNQAADYAFYALDAGTLSLALRLYRVDPREDGGADITERPTPASTPVLHRIDASGVRTEILQPSGLILRMQR